MKNGNSKPIIYKELYILILLGIFTVAMWHFVPYGRLILYPFTILGTWFHEMGHGLTALILGGNFHKLELFPDGSGVAYWSGDVFLGGIGASMVAFGGPIGPTIFGSLFMLGSKELKRTRIILLILSLFMIASVIIWVRTLFGAGILLIIGALIMLIALKSNEKFCKYTLQFLAVQCFLSLYLSIDYLFSCSGASEFGVYYSDTCHIQKYLYLPYWFWASLIVGFSVFMFYISLRLLAKGRSK